MAAATVGEITETDIPEVAEFLARQVPLGEAKSTAPLPPVMRLRWLLLDNPARAAGVPFGWRIRDEKNAVVGAAICSPFRISSGDAVLVALMFSKFYVDEPYRGIGLGLLMRFIRLGERYPLFCTSTNAVAGAMFAKLGALPINGLDHTMLGIFRPRPLVEEWLFRRTKSPAAARVLSLPAAIAPGRIGHSSKVQSGALHPITSVEELTTLDLPQPADLNAVIRDRDYLVWRYFSGDRDKHVFRFAYPDESDRLVVINEVRAGHRGQIRVLNVLDVWPPASAVSAPALCGQLSLRYASRTDVIWLRSQSAEVENAVRETGFVRHDFPAPLGWYFDRGNKLAVKDWYIMPGESE